MDSRAHTPACKRRNYIVRFDTDHIKHQQLWMWSSQKKKDAPPPHVPGWYIQVTRTYFTTTPCVIHLEEYFKSKWKTKSKMWSRSGHSWVNKISLNVTHTHTQLWASTAPLLLHKVFTAATHYQRTNLTPVWMPLHELIAHKVTAGTGLDQNCEMEPLNASNETIPFFPNQLLKLGHQIKDKQLQRPNSDKIVHEDYNANGGQWQPFHFFLSSVITGQKKCDIWHVILPLMWLQQFYQNWKMEILIFLRPVYSPS